MTTFEWGLVFTILILIKFKLKREFQLWKNNKKQMIKFILKYIVFICIMHILHVSFPVLVSEELENLSSVEGTLSSASSRRSVTQIRIGENNLLFHFHLCDIETLEPFENKKIKVWYKEINGILYHAGEVYQISRNGQIINDISIANKNTVLYNIILVPLPYLVSLLVLFYISLSEMRDRKNVPDQSE